MDWRTTRNEGFSPAQMLKTLGIHLPPVSALEIASSLAVQIVETEPVGWKSALRITPNHAIIWFDSRMPSPDVNVFVGLELGRIHYCRFGDYTDNNLLFGPGERQKQAALHWAMDLLVPADWLRFYGAPARFRLPKLAELFDVGMNAMTWQAERLLRSRQLY